MLSAHNTIFLLPRLQHIVLSEKQSFQPILFVMVRGSGRAHLGKRRRHTRGKAAEERKLVRNPDTPKGSVDGSSCLIHPPLLFFPWCRGSQMRACALLHQNPVQCLQKYEGPSVQSLTYWTTVPEECDQKLAF